MPGFGQMPLAPAKASTSLGFPRMGGTPQAQPMGAPSPQLGTAAAAPTPVTAPAPVENQPTSVIGPGGPPAPGVAAPAPSPSPPIMAPSPGGPHMHPDNDHIGGFEQRMQDKLTRMASRNPGFLDRIQTMMGQNRGLFEHLQRRDPGFDWTGFINGLKPAAPAAPPVGPAAGPSTAISSLAPVGSTAATLTAPTPAPAPAAIFNPLNLPGIGG